MRLTGKVWSTGNWTIKRIQHSRLSYGNDSSRLRKLGSSRRWLQQGHVPCRPDGQLRHPRLNDRNKRLWSKRRYRRNRRRACLTFAGQTLTMDYRWPRLAPAISHRVRTIQNLSLGLLADQYAGTISDAKPPKLFVNCWLDYSGKYGMGFAMTDGSVSVHFNDSSNVVLAPGQK